MVVVFAPEDEATVRGLWPVSRVAVGDPAHCTWKGAPGRLLCHPFTDAEELAILRALFPVCGFDMDSVSWDAETAP